MKMLGRMALLGLAAAALLVAPQVAWAAADAVAVAVPAGPAVAVVPASPWMELWAQIQAPLAAIVTAVFGVVGTFLAVFLPRYLGNRGSEAVNGIYQMVADQAAGWLISHMHSSTGGGAVDPREATVGLSKAIDYAKQSYPDVIKKLDVKDGELGKDIVAAAGKLLAKGPGGGIASAIGALVTKSR